MKHSNRVFSMLLTMAWLPLVYSQNIHGNIHVQTGETNHTWTAVSIGAIQTQCDSSGHFQLTKIISQKDTLNISPIPLFLDVNFINIPTENSALIFDSIPFFF